MRYVSTRGDAPARSFSDILLEGLAPDGGLYLPEEFPRIDLKSLRGRPYVDLAAGILSRYMDDVPELGRIVRATYTARVFGADEITPLRKLERGLYLLGLSNGPTLAFKDIALQLLGSLFERILEDRNESLNILGATSGDTGSAAEYAMRGKKGIRVFMLSPNARMSSFQRAQMFSLQDPNIHNLAVKGVFDDCQDLVKAVNADAAFKARNRIGAVNSINWARVAAQIVYYFKAYFAATQADSEQVDFAVPSGNFGNICAGYVARRMGLPIRRLILATNENSVLDEFFRTGRYRVRRKVHETSSPSMDISKASNFERYVFDLVGREGARVKDLWRRLDQDGEFDLSRSPWFAAVRASGFVSGSSSHEDRLRTIRLVHERFGVVIDPHTADGVKVGLEHREPLVPLICLETALPAKFAATIRAALGRVPERPAELADLEKRPQRFEVVANDPEALKRRIEAAL
ncbi:MAG TPA: threonine synthase [Burkholderiales bacterium]|nr:threonine synthase [Burkholderiales bacterium]